MPTRINRLAVQFAQDGHLSFRQKWRSLVMQAFGHEALISSDDLVKNGHCPTLNTDTYRLKSIERRHLAWRKLLNPFKWLEFIVSWLEFLPWLIHHNISKHLSNGLLGYLAVFLHLMIHSVLAIIRPFLAPARHIIRPSIQLAKSHPLAFNVMLLTTLILAGGISWFLLIGNGLWMMVGITLAGNFAAQLGILALTAILFWTLLLKCHTFFSRLLDIQKNRDVDINTQTVEVYAPKASTSNISRLLFGLDPEQTEIIAAEEQGFWHSFALFAGLEEILYPEPTEEAKKDFVHFEAQFFLKAKDGVVTPRSEAKALVTLNAFIQNFCHLPQNEMKTTEGGEKIRAHINQLANIIQLELVPSQELEQQRKAVIQALMHKMQNIGDIMKIEEVMVLLLKDSFESNIEAAKLVMRYQPETQASQNLHV